MRLSTICVCSTAHLPPGERAAFDDLIARAPRREGRLIVDHTVLTIEAHQYGFAVHLGVLDDHPTRPDEISEPMWRLLNFAKDLGAAWLWFDCDEPSHEGFAIWPEPGVPVLAKSPISIRCEKCGGTDVIRDASARWDEIAQDWSLSGVFDAAFCETCDGDAHLAEIPLTQVATPVAA